MTLTTIKYYLEIFKSRYVTWYHNWARLLLMGRIQMFRQVYLPSPHLLTFPSTSIFWAE